MPTVDDLCRSYLDLKWHYDPAAASADGIVAQDHRLGRFDRDAVRTYVAALRSLAGAVEALDVDDLQEEIDRTALLGELRSATARWEREQPHVRDPSLWLSHLLHAVYTVLNRATLGPEAGATRAAAILARLQDVPALLDTARATLDAPPPVFVDTALGMLGGGGELIVQATTLLSTETPALSAELNTAATAALEALTRFGRALRDEIEPSDDPQAFAIGEEQFSRRLHYEHALASEAPELWRYGAHLQEEVEAELVRATAAAGLGGSWRDAIERLREDAPPADQLLDTYRAELERARDFLTAQGVVTVPDTPLEVVPTPAFLRPMMPFAAYEPPPIHMAGQAGRFYVTLPEPGATAEASERERRQHARPAIPALVVHEAYPGHHLQLATARGLRSEVRRHLWTPMMVEGWALYCEQLMAETGYYATPEARLFQLVNLLWRAARVVLDVGLHTRGMTPVEAVQYLTDHLPIERRHAEAEVRRYCAYPTYQLSYAVGRRELLRLRDSFSARAGAGTGGNGIRRFHDELLRYGGLPVSLARWGMGLDE